MEINFIGMIKKGFRFEMNREITRQSEFEVKNDITMYKVMNEDKYIFRDLMVLGIL